MTPLPQTIVQSHMLDIFCPLAEDIGNLADWAAVAVALFGAIAVFQLSRAANATARGVKRVAEREARDRRAAAAREGRLLLIYLENEFRQALTAFGTLATGLDVVDHDSFIDSGYARAQFLSEADGISLKLSREMFHRLHVLVDKDAHDIARVVSGLSVLQQAAAETASIDLSETMPGVDGASWNEFRRETLSERFVLLRKGAAEMQVILIRLIQEAVAAKVVAGAQHHTLENNARGPSTAG
ncbi:hypothetical protein XEUV259_19150 [Xanthomonas euvesicatoria]|nr:hypothetical protein XEUV259_19150 [Xanthomonas euvesicatoria]KLB64548.1 hypothetical protein XEUV315_18475 [Xanthomonas euvesicatoria]